MNDPLRADEVRLPDENVPRLLASVIAVAVAAVCTYQMRRADPDLWGYLDFGRLFVDRGSVIVEDPFAYTSAGTYWVTFEYLAQTALWLSYRTLGPLGLIVLKCIVGGFTMFFLYAAIRQSRDAAVALAVFPLAASLVARYFLFRPQLFTFAFFSLFVAILFADLAGRRAPLWLLPPVMLLWSNAHGGFLAGLGAIGLTLLLRVAANLDGRASLFRGTGRLWLTLTACALVTLVNPHGLRLWGYVTTEVLHGTNRQYIVEWRPPSLNGDAWSAVGFTALTVALVLATAVAQVHARGATRPKPIFWGVSCLPLVWMAYTAVRHVPLAVLWIAPVIALLGRAGRTARPTSLSWMWLGLGGLGFTAFLITLSAVVSEPRPVVSTSGGVLGANHPCRVVEFFRENRLTGNVYNPLWWGSFFTWELHPQIKVAMDGRNITAFPRTVVRDNLRFFSDPAESVDLETPFRHATDFLVVPANTAALPRVRRDARWQEIHADPDAVLFVRQDRVGLIGSRELRTPQSPCRSHLQ